MVEDEHCDILILGAGAAGIGAARRLLEQQGEQNGNASTHAPSAANIFRVVVLEARHRAGGRAWTSDELQCGLELDHGGQWIHGSTARNPMLELAARCGISTTPMKWENGEDITRVVLASSASNDDGRPFSMAPSRKAEKASKLLFKQLCKYSKGSLIAAFRSKLPVETSFKDCLLEIAKREMPDKAFNEWLESKARNALKASGVNSKTHKNEMPPLIAETVALLRLQVYYRLESYEGCRMDKCSLRHTYDGTILPGGDCNVVDGYGKFVQTLATSVPMDIRYAHRVLSIEWTSSSSNVRPKDNPHGVAVTVSTEEEDGSRSNQRFVAKVGCIVALPLGVLQHVIGNPEAQNPLFIPPLPETLLGSIDRLGVCLMNKIEMLFSRQWWPDGTSCMEIASESDKTSDDFPLSDMPWSSWIVAGNNPPVLVCYATGVFAERIESMTDSEVGKEGVIALRHAFLNNKLDGCRSGTIITCIPDPLRVHVTRWRSDPFARGSWTFFKAGTRGMKDVNAFQKFNSKKLEKLYFAGEHTCDGSVDGLDIGTVHGAYLSGRLAADELLVKNSTSSD